MIGPGLAGLERELPQGHPDGDRSDELAGVGLQSIEKRPLFCQRLKATHEGPSGVPVSQNLSQRVRLGLVDEDGIDVGGELSSG